MKPKPPKDKKSDLKKYEKKVKLNTTFEEAISLLAAAANKKSLHRQTANKG